MQEWYEGDVNHRDSADRHLQTFKENVLNYAKIAQGFDYGLWYPFE